MMKNVESYPCWQDPAHASNQGSIIRLANGELLLGYNQERGLAHADSGQSCLIKSRDGGLTWDPASGWWCAWSEHVGNWDCAFAQVRRHGPDAHASLQFHGADRVEERR